MGWCCYCGRSLSDGGNDDASPTVEHVIPTSRGGRYQKHNKRIACKRCNGEKGDMTPAEYEEFLARMASVTRFHAAAAKQIRADIEGRRRKRLRR